MEKGTPGMASTRMTRDQIAKSVTPERRAEFQRRVDAATDADINRQMIEDGEDPDSEIADADIISPAHIRRRLGMTQEAFAIASACRSAPCATGSRTESPWNRPPWPCSASWPATRKQPCAPWPA
jgi:hypothetical protein